MSGRDNLLVFLAGLFGVLAIASLAMAHPGGLDSQGGHHDRKSGGYHSHNGPSVDSDMSAKPKPEPDTETVRPLPDHKKGGGIVSRTGSGDPIWVDHGIDNDLLREDDELFAIQSDVRVWPAPTRNYISAGSIPSVVAAGRRVKMVDFAENHEIDWVKIAIFSEDFESLGWGWTHSSELGRATGGSSSPSAQTKRRTVVQHIASNKTSANPVCEKGAVVARNDLKAALMDQYRGHYSVIDTLMKSGMKNYEKICSLPDTPVNNEILTDLNARYYPRFSVIYTLYESNIKSYRNLQR